MMDMTGAETSCRNCGRNEERIKEKKSCRTRARELASSAENSFRSSLSAGDDDSFTLELQ